MRKFDKNTLTIDNIFVNRFTHNNKEVQCLVFEWGATLVLGSIHYILTIKI